MKSTKTRVALVGLIISLVVASVLLITVAEEQELSFPEQVIVLVNQERAKKNLSQLTLNEDLIPPANLRAKESAKKFSHTRPDGRAWSTAFDEFEIVATLRGENLAYGQKDPARVMKAWMNSTGHRKNIMHERFTALAVGLYEQKGVLYWSQLFVEILSGDLPVQAAPPPPVAADASLGPVAVVSGINLNLRSQANSKSDVITVMVDGTQVNILETVKSWSRVRMPDGTEGWASTKYLKMLD